eukprot:TRINITY_DN3471_c0_g1_i1.p1 TRINITY_DN3471_c0_g1~~TRINITY_DN3471_c0_g1_i1.p1  ORF type:complete len:517 (+),score=116.30 TRINITY_DN3471_c0_g1_i1:212-1762(+)
MTQSRHLLVVLVFLVLLEVSRAGIVTFKANKTKIGEDEQFLHKEGMFAPDDAPSKSSPGNGASYIMIDLEARPAGKLVGEESSVVTILAFNYEEQAHIGVKIGKETEICCTKALLENGNCTEVGSVIVDDHEAKNLWSIPVHFNKDDQKFSWNQTINITKSGMYYFYIVNCADSGAGDVFFEGRVVFMHPYGYLNGELYYHMPFFGALAILYIGLGMFWIVRCIQYRKQLLQLQKWIGLVILLGFFESAINCFDNVGYNRAGVNYVGAMIVGVLVSTMKRSVSRVFVLVVSMGYGVVRPTLGESKIKVIILGVLYVIFSGVLDVVDLVERKATFTFYVLLFLVFPVAALDTGFYWSIIISLMRTIQQLAARKQSIKLTMYKRFLGILALCGVFSAIFILIQVLAVSVADSDKNWKTGWLWKTCWQILYFVILLAIAIIWRPTSNNTRYAYSEMTSIDNDEITLQPLTSLGDISQRKKSDDSKEFTGINKSDSAKLTELDVAFSIDDDDKDIAIKME